MKKKIVSLVLAIVIFSSMANGQTAEVSVTLNEQFFDTLLDAIFKNFNAPEFPLASSDSKFSNESLAFKQKDSLWLSKSFRRTNFSDANETRLANLKYKSEIAGSRLNSCNETIRLQREIDGVKTAVRFREGKLFAPIAFSGSYNPPFIGCVEFQGWAETNIDLEYNRQSQKLLGRVRVLSVNLGGVSNLASGVLSRLVQSSIDKKINPVEILQTDKLSFIVPVQTAGGSLKMRATSVRHEINNGALNIHVAYEFLKGN